jgi:shikimate kinase
MHSREMPLFPYLSIIIWRGMTMLGATDDDAQSMADPTDVTMNRASIVAFPAPRAATADLLLRRRSL